MLMPILGSSFEKRKASILKAASQDLEIGFLLAVFNFEWTLRRMILSFSKCPSIVIRALLAQSSGLWKYCHLWDICVHGFDSRFGKMREILAGGFDSKSNLKAISEYLRCRHVLVHGAKSGIGAATALCGIRKLLEVSENLARFSHDNGHELFEKIPSRQQVRCGFTGNRKTPVFEEGLACATCPGNIIVHCPFLKKLEKDQERDSKQLGDYIREKIKDLRAKTSPVNELINVKDEALVKKIKEVADELGIADAPSVAEAVRELEKAFEERQSRHSTNAEAKEHSIKES